MRKTMRNAVKREAHVQALGLLKTTGTPDERAAARRKLANGLSGRYQIGQRVDSKLVCTMAMLRGTGFAMV